MTKAKFLNQGLRDEVFRATFVRQGHALRDKVLRTRTFFQDKLFMTNSSGQDLFDKFFGGKAFVTRAHSAEQCFQDKVLRDNLFENDKLFWTRLSRQEL